MSQRKAVTRATATGYPSASKTAKAVIVDKVWAVMNAATIDRRLAGERKRLELRGRSGTKPGPLLKSLNRAQIRRAVLVLQDRLATTGQAKAPARHAAGETTAGYAGMLT